MELNIDNASAAVLIYEYNEYTITIALLLLGRQLKPQQYDWTLTGANKMEFHIVEFHFVTTNRLNGGDSEIQHYYCSYKYEQAMSFNFYFP